jgi:hypothetical protein
MQLPKAWAMISVIGQNEVSLSAYRATLDLNSEFWTSLGSRCGSALLHIDLIGGLHSPWPSGFPNGRGKCGYPGAQLESGFPASGLVSCAFIIPLAKWIACALGGLARLIIRLPQNSRSWCATVLALALFSVMLARKFHFSPSSFFLFCAPNLCWL